MTLPVSMEMAAKAVLRRMGQAVTEPEFAAYVYEHADAREVKDTTLTLSGVLVVTESHIKLQERAPRPDVAYNSLVRVTVMNLAHSFAKQITRELAVERRSFRFTVSQSPSTLPLGGGWYLDVWWREPKDA